MTGPGEGYVEITKEEAVKLISKHGLVDRISAMMGGQFWYDPAEVAKPDFQSGYPGVRVAFHAYSGYEGDREYWEAATELVERPFKLPNPTPWTDKPTAPAMATGFHAFQAVLESVIDMLGGDDLAVRAATTAFDQAVRHVMRSNDYSWGYAAAWTRMGAEKWTEAIEVADRILSTAQPHPRGEGMLGEFRVIWGASSLIRPGKRAGYGIRLASSTMRPDYDRRANAMKERWSISWDDAGEYLAKKRGRGPKAKVTYADSEAGAVRTIARIAKELGVV